MKRGMQGLLNRALLLRSRGRIKPVRPMERVPFVSVVIPCYNYGRYLRRCISSVTESQPGIRIEVIIVDDKSTDDSLDVALRIAAEDSRVKVIPNEVNKGHIATYNSGLAAASGEFVILLSADDLVTPGALTRAAALLVAEESVGMVYGGVVQFGSEPPPCRTAGNGWIVWPGLNWLQARCRSGYNVIASPEVMMRTSVLSTTGGYRSDLPHAGDFEMWLRTASVSDVGFLLGVDQAFYRIHDFNMHKKDFKSGTDHGYFIDLRQRWKAFETVFSGVGRRLKDSGSLIKTARFTMMRHVLGHANYVHVRTHEFSTEQFELFSQEFALNGDLGRVVRSLARRKRRNISLILLYPVLVVLAVMWRAEEIARRWKRRRIGI